MAFSLLVVVFGLFTALLLSVSFCLVTTTQGRITLSVTEIGAK